MYFTEILILAVYTEEPTVIGQFTAGTTAETLAFAFFVCRQDARECAFELSRPGIFF